MISLFKKIFKSNILLIIIAEKISTFFNINFEDEYKIVRLINKPIILDIGAHKGESIVNFLKENKNCKIFSYEPNIYVFKKLKKKFAQNKKVKLFNIAISKKKIDFLYIPKVYFFTLSLWASFNKKYLIDRWENFTSISINKIKIIKIKLNSIQMDTIKIKPNLLKIDTEGAEFEVINSGKKLIKKYKPIIILEFNKYSFNKAKKILSSYNYRAYKFDGSTKILYNISNKDIVTALHSKNSVNFIFYNMKSNLLDKKNFLNKTII